MKKIKTTIGYLYLLDERTAENTTSLFNKMTSRKEINMIVITSDDAKKAYRTVNPYGVGYTDYDVTVKNLDFTNKYSTVIESL